MLHCRMSKDCGWTDQYPQLQAWVHATKIETLPGLFCGLEPTCASADAITAELQPRKSTIGDACDKHQA